MTVLHLTPELTACVDRFSVNFNLVRMEALAMLPGNPYGVEIWLFGTGRAACKVRHPLLRGKNRIHGFAANDVDFLGDLLDFYRTDGLCCTLSVPHGRMPPELFRRLAQADLWSSGSGTVPVIAPADRAEDSVPPTPPEIKVRVSGIEEKELYLGLFQKAFADREEADPEYRAFQWAEDSLPGGTRYIAEIGGKPVGLASFPVVDGVGYFGTGGVLPAFRGRGVQMALIRRRISDAPVLGCELILGGGSPGTTYYRNFERAGLRLIPTGSTWTARE